jgi:hypothetical protein
VTVRGDAPRRIVRASLLDSTGTCPTFHTWHDGGGTWTGLGASTFNLDYCVTLQAGGQDSPLVGTFTITAEGGTLTGDVTGFVGGASEPEGWPAHYELTVTGGTGDYARASGNLVFEAFWDGEDIPVYSIHGTVSGTVAVSPPVPTSADDCRNGGWRNLGDETGEPFKNQGDCIAWALHNT